MDRPIECREKELIGLFNEFFQKMNLSYEDFNLVFHCTSEELDIITELEIKHPKLGIGRINMAEQYLNS